jgi:hypothetical protein
MDYFISEDTTCGTEDISRISLTGMPVVTETLSIASSYLSEKGMYFSIQDLVTHVMPSRIALVQIWLPFPVHHLRTT